MLFSNDLSTANTFSTFLQLTISAPVAEQVAEDDISDPEEDSLAGQMALMRGGKVKKRPEGEESDDDSTTDDDEKSDESSSSDSD